MADEITPPPLATRPDDPARSRDWRRLHLWQIQPIRDAAVLLLFLGLFKLGYLLSAVTVPLLIAILLAYLFEPVVRKLPRATGAAATDACLQTRDR